MTTLHEPRRAPDSSADAADSNSNPNISRNDAAMTEVALAVLRQISKASCEVSPIAMENSPLAHWSPGRGEVVLKDTR